MEWLNSLAIAVIVAGSTVLGIVLQGWSAARHAREERREKARADEQARAAAERAEARDVAAQVVARFLAASKEADSIRLDCQGDDIVFSAWFGDKWRESHRDAVRRAVGRVRATRERRALTELIEVISEERLYTSVVVINTSVDVVQGALSLGMEIGMAMEREQQLDAEVLAAHDAVVTGFKNWEEADGRRKAFELSRERRTQIEQEPTKYMTLDDEVDSG